MSYLLSFTVCALIVRPSVLAKRDVEYDYLRPELTRVMGSAEYCVTESFQPSCQPGEVVVMKKAFYGMQDVDRCIKTDYGFVGCGSHVIRHLDDKCSGQLTCDVLIPDAELERLNTCPPEFSSFLNATYACVQVRAEDCSSCLGVGPVSVARVTSSYGYIPSVLKESRGCGQPRCPWRIEGKPGQVINLTLYDFHDYSTKVNDKYPYDPSGFCIRLGTIKEKSSGESFSICGGRKRVHHLRTTVSHSVDIWFSDSQGSMGQSILFYEVLGCPDIDIGSDKDLDMYREGNTLKVTCLSNGNQYELTCRGEEWRGDLGSCPGATGDSRANKDGIITLHKGVLAAIVIGIALVVGVLILTVGVICLKRQQPPGYYYPGPRHDYEYAMDTGSQLYMAPKTCPQPMEPSKYQPVLPLQRHDRHWHQRKLDLQSRPLPSLPNITEASVTTSGSSQDEPPQQALVEIHPVPDTDRRYLTNPRPVGNRRHSANSSGANSANNSRGSSKTDPQYFILEGDRDPSTPQGIAAAQARQAARAAGVVGIPAPPPPAPVMIPPTAGSDSGSSDRDPDDDNKQNSDKELSRNNSCHEIPLRPSREQPNVNNVRTENTTGKTSWP